jgi:hypothetical protein
LIYPTTNGRAIMVTTEGTTFENVPIENHIVLLIIPENTNTIKVATTDCGQLALRADNAAFLYS